MNLSLIRDADNGRCTLGTLQIGSAVFQSLERPWIPGPPGGEKGISCVPTGRYELMLHDSEAHPRSFALVNPALHVFHMQVPREQQGRAACLIHVANHPSEIRGCIALGMERGPNSVQRSRIAIDRFYSLVPWVSGHTLEITEKST